jgi:trehalose synthase
MARPKFVKIAPRSPQRWRPLLGDRAGWFDEVIAQARERYEGRAVWHVSSTLHGGGVAELLHSLLPYVRGAGIDTRWVVIRERPQFFALTKRLHNLLHDAGDGEPLNAAERRLYEEAREDGGGHLAALVRPGDVVFLHDPQTAGLAEIAKATGATVLWRCHVGVDRPGEAARSAWRFLTPYVEAADLYVFSRREYVWETLDPDRARIMTPSLDPFSPKNEELGAEAVEAIVGAIGLGPSPNGGAPSFRRADDSPGRVERRATLLQEQPLGTNVPAVVQISRWDRLKDHLGLLRGFAAHLAGGDAHLVLAGPEAGAVTDDPEGEVVWKEVEAAWRELPADRRAAVHLVNLPMADQDENAAIVNALQRRAQVVVQKSLAEGFGLTVAEAMWKGRPVVGARVGGIQDQIVDGVSGLLADPADDAAVAAAIGSLLADRARAAALGAAARERVTEHFLGGARLAEYAQLLIELEDRR